MKQLLLTYPSDPGYKVGGTSQDAARAVRGRASILRGRVEEAFCAAGALTADECADILGESVLSIRPRVTELKVAGVLEKTGDRKRNRSGMSASVYRFKS